MEWKDIPKLNKYNDKALKKTNKPTRERNRTLTGCGTVLLICVMIWIVIICLCIKFCS